MRELLLVAFVLFVFVWFQEGPVSVPRVPRYVRGKAHNMIDGCKCDARPMEVLFLPCQVDGFWSNMRQVLRTYYVAGRNGAVWVSPNVSTMYQQSGKVTDKVKGIRLDSLITFPGTRPDLNTFLRCMEICGDGVLVQNNARDREKPMGGCRANKEQNPLVQYRCAKSIDTEFMPKINVPIHHLPMDHSRLDAALQDKGKGRAIVATVPYIYPGIGQQMSFPNPWYLGDIDRVEHGWQKVARDLNFSSTVNAYADQFMNKLTPKIGPLVALHIRDGNLYALDWLKNRVMTDDDLVRSFEKVITCVNASQGINLFLSTLPPCSTLSMSPRYHGFGKLICCPIPGYMYGTVATIALPFPLSCNAASRRLWSIGR